MKIERNEKDLKQEFDVVIIGAGITGVSVARECQERGLRTFILDQNDFGWATSASTSKLIHGGLRYLENFEFGLVRESLRERKILGNAASHLIRPLPIILPVYGYSKPGKFMMRIGLKLYDILSFERNYGTPKDKYMPSSHLISPEKLLKLTPCMKKENLKGGLIFYDYQSLHPERLLLSFLKSAVSSGCTAWNHAKAESFTLVKEGTSVRVKAVQFTDNLNKKKHTVKGKVFVNCAGPWMDYVLSGVQENPETVLKRSTGIHILSENICSKTHALLHRNEEGRHFFILPWKGLSLSGPTDTAYTEHPDELYPAYSDTMKLFNDVKNSLAADFSESSIKSVIIGIRPLISSGKSTYKTSRKSEIFDHEKSGINGFLSVGGGKWTTSRALGEETTLKLLKKIELKGIKTLRVNTRKAPLFGSPCFANSYEDYEKHALKHYAIPEVSEGVHKHLIQMYGTEHRELLHLIQKDPTSAELVSKRMNSYEIKAQIHYAVTHESAKKIEDVLNRRMEGGTTGYPGDEALKITADILGKLLGWTPSQKKKEIQNYKDNFPLLKNTKKSNSKRHLL